MSLTLGNHEYGPGGPTLCIAELSGNHGGRLGDALRLIGAAKAAGADAVKLQCYTPDELLWLRHNGQDGPAPDPWAQYTLRELYARSQTPWDWFPTLFQHAATLEIPLFSSVFGLAGLAFLEGQGCPAYKIAAPESHNVGLVRAVRDTGKPVIASTNYLRNHVRADAVLWCPPGYPPPALHLDNVFLCDGLSCHLPEPVTGPMAVAHGAWILEYHLKLADDPALPDNGVSLTPEGFAEMVRLVRRAERLR